MLSNHATNVQCAFVAQPKIIKASRKAKLTTCMSDPFTSEKTGEDLFN